MFVIEARNVHQALPFGLTYLKHKGVWRDSRNSAIMGRVLVAPEPVTTHYQYPLERVLFWPERDANPFFHFFEALWMLAGKNNLSYLTQFVKTFKGFSDDGETLHGAYGYRWRHQFQVDDLNTGEDQLGPIVEQLKSDPTSRRAVLTMWDPDIDLDTHSNDLPCNTHAYFLINFEGALDMTVCCRSNDMIWGGYGANAVHFSFLQEYMALRIGVPVGSYWQMSNNFHVYEKTLTPQIKTLIDRYVEATPYEKYTDIKTIPLFEKGMHDTWINELGSFVDNCELFSIADIQGYRKHKAFGNPFFNDVVLPLFEAHLQYKQRNYQFAQNALDNCTAEDWGMAAREWLQRREAAHNKAKDDGVSYDNGK